MKKQLIWVFESRKSVHYWWSYISFAPECKELTCIQDPLSYRWGVPPVVIRCVDWTMQREVLQTWITPQRPTILMYMVLFPLNNLAYQGLINIDFTWKFLSSPCPWIYFRQSKNISGTLNSLCQSHICEHKYRVNVGDDLAKPGDMASVDMIFTYSTPPWTF